MSQPSSRQARRRRKLDRAAARLGGPGKVAPADRAVALLEAVLEPGDRLCIEGDNQKQAAFLARCLARVDPRAVHGVSLALSAIALPEFLDVFERGICDSVDFAYAGPQAARLARMVESGQVRINAIHTYLELYGRYFTDLRLDVACVAALQADAAGNLYTGPSTEETPAIVEAAAFNGGLVIAQASEIVERLPRVDIPGDWVDFVVPSPDPFRLEPVFTRDPEQITDVMILMGLLAMKGLYAAYRPRTLNHGIGFNTAAIELMLPTYGAELGLKGKACTHWVLNPHPTLIPAIEAGFVERVATVGSEVGMNGYVAARPDIFSIGADGSMRSNRAFGQLAGHYADLFIGSTLQIDPQGNSSTVTCGRLVGYGGAPNFGCDSGARRHGSESWLKAGAECYPPPHMPRGRKLVVQIVETFRDPLQPSFVERLDAWEVQRQARMPLPPIMVYGEDLTHIVTEEGIAHLLRCRRADEREQAVRGVAGYTPVGLARDRRAVENLRDRGIIQRAEDLGIRKRDATRDRLAARTLRDLVAWSGGLYRPPDRLRRW